MCVLSFTVKPAPPSSCPVSKHQDSDGKNETLFLSYILSVVYFNKYSYWKCPSTYVVQPGNLWGQQRGYCAQIWIETYLQSLVNFSCPPWNWWSCFQVLKLHDHPVLCESLEPLLISLYFTSNEHRVLCGLKNFEEIGHVEDKQKEDVAGLKK